MSYSTSGIEQSQKAASVVITELRARIQQLEGEVKSLEELRTMNLAAISTASIQNTETTIKDRITDDNPYWTVAYSDVCRAIDREMEHREQAAQHLVLIEKAKAVLIDCNIYFKNFKQDQMIKEVLADIAALERGKS